MSDSTGRPDEPGIWVNGTTTINCRWCYEDEGPPWLGYPHPRSGKIVPVQMLPTGGWSKAGSELTVLRADNERLKLQVPNWNDREKAVIAELSASQELTAHQVLRQALRLYQVHVERLKAGETCTWSGDEQRAAEFVGGQKVGGT